MPASCNYSLLRFFIQKLTTTSGSLQLSPEIIYNILVVQEFIQSCFKHSVSRHNPVWQTVPRVHHSASKTKLSQIIFDLRLLKSQIVTSGYKHISFMQSRINFPAVKNFVEFLARPDGRANRVTNFCTRTQLSSTLEFFGGDVHRSYTGLHYTYIRLHVTG